MFLMLIASPNGTAVLSFENIIYNLFQGYFYNQEKMVLLAKALIEEKIRLHRINIFVFMVTPFTSI